MLGEFVDFEDYLGGVGDIFAYCDVLVLWVAVFGDGNYFLLFGVACAAFEFYGWKAFDEV